jgi:hypothetical protein
VSNRRNFPALVRGFFEYEITFFRTVEHPLDPEFVGEGAEVIAQSMTRSDILILAIQHIDNY